MKSKFPDLSILPTIFERYPGIQAVYLFGSAASGKTHTESDIDLGIVPRHPSLRAEKLNILADLTKGGFDNIDLVFLDVNDIVVRFEAVRQNRLVYCVPGFDADSFFSLTLRQYFDFMPYLKVQREAYKRRTLHHG
ncbi:MAG: nucleotidyltransferase domain-containing protein [Chloroflexi bacterium]|nr:nucleotidyltransferase domain-containing protein [Chloroflexota bacterium]